MAKVSDRTRVRRNAGRAEYDDDVIRRILDANQFCHVAFVVDGEPRIIPTLYMRRGDHVYLHGNRQSAMLRHLGAGGLAALSVMSAEGIVVARSGFHCSMNYHSVVLFGHAEPVPEAEHRAVLDGFVEALIPGHLSRVREATPQELAATAAVRLPIDEASAKVRTGDPIDDAGDMDDDVWAGVIPLLTTVGDAVPSSDLKAGVDVPDYVRDYRLPGDRTGPRVPT
jgi:nitroimidazol reductase NimA-like FMN-containing flavoprotein (pyridoxamine 5'-phosphate oxidase superfamily)